MTLKISKLNVGDKFRLLFDQQFNTIDILEKEHIAFSNNYNECLLLDKNKYYITVLTSYNFILSKNKIIKMIPLNSKVKVKKI